MSTHFLPPAQSEGLIALKWLLDLPLTAHRRRCVFRRLSTAGVSAGVLVAASLLLPFMRYDSVSPLVLVRSDYRSVMTGAICK